MSQWRLLISKTFQNCKICALLNMQQKVEGQQKIECQKTLLVRIDKIVYFFITKSIHINERVIVKLTNRLSLCIILNQEQILTFDFKACSIE